MILRTLRLPASLLTPVLAAGCSLSIGGQLDELDTGLTAPSVVGLGDPCVPAAGLAVNGSRPANTRVIAVITPTTGADTEVELAALGAETSWSGTLAIAAEGDYAVSVVAENAGGTRSAPSGEVALRVDRTAPGAPTGTFPTSANSNSTASVTLNADDDVESIACGAGSNVIGAGDTFEASFTIHEGANTFACIATDTCGLTSPATPVSITGETLRPLDAPIVLVTPADTRLAAGTTTTTVTVGGTAAGATAVLLGVDAAAPIRQTLGAGDSWSFDVELDSGVHFLELIATDDDDSTLDSAATDVPVEIFPTLDAPTLTCPTSPTKATELTVSGTRPEGAGVKATITTAPAQAAVTLAAVDAAGTTFSGSLPFATQLDGEHRFTVASFDRGGDGGSVECVVVVDRTAPAPADIDEVDAVIARNTTTGNVTFSGTGEVGATVTASLPGGAVQNVGTVGTDGRFSFVLPVTLTTTSITIVLADAAGNTSTATATFTVRQALPALTLTAPRANTFPLTTNQASLALTGSKLAGSGVRVKFTDGGATVDLVESTAQTTFATVLPLNRNATTSFCLYQFNGAEEGPPLCRGSTETSPLVVTHDDVEPNAPVVTVDLAVQTATITATITKEANASLTVARNSATATVVDATAATSVTTTLNLDLGDTVFCFVQTDAATNVSDETCVTIRRTAPGLDLIAPKTFAVLNDDALFVEAELADTTGTSYEVCVTTPPRAEACQTFAADIDGRLERTITIDAAPATATIATVKVCGTDGRVSNICASRELVRQGLPEQRSASVTTDPKNDPQIVVDALGFTHLVWTDANICSVGHSDVITNISRANPGNRVQLNVARPAQLGLVQGDRFEITGTNAFNGSYEVLSVVNNLVTTRETRATGAAETAGNIQTRAVDTTCRPNDIFYSRFDDAGWSPIVNLSDVGGDAVSTAPTIVVDSAGDIHVAWVEAGNLNPVNGAARPPQAPADGGGTTDIIHRVIDGLSGAISLPIVVSTQDDLNSAFVSDRAPSLAAGINDVLLVWHSQLSTSSQAILLSRFNGTAWAAPKTIATIASTTAPTPAVVQGSAGAYVAWQEKTGRQISDGANVGGAGAEVGSDVDIVLCALINDTCFTNADLLVSAGADTGVSTEPVLAVTGTGTAEVVHVLWSDGESRSVNLRRVLHKSFQLRVSPRVIGTQTTVSATLATTNAISPSVAVTPDAAELFAVWVDNTPVAGHAPFTVSGALGAVDGLTTTFSSTGLLLPGDGSVTTSTTKPAVAVGADRNAWITVVQQANQAVADSEIVVYPTTY